MEPGKNCGKALGLPEVYYPLLGFPRNFHHLLMKFLSQSNFNLQANVSQPPASSAT
jgi:hypothetical protein